MASTKQPQSSDRDEAPSVPGGHVRDLRVPPRGALPRQVQTWLMLGVALVIVGIILVAGHPQPPERQDAARPQEPTLTQPERVRSFQQQLTDDEVRLRQMAQRQDQQTQRQASPAPAPATAGSRPAVESVDRDAQSLHADNVAFSRRSGTAQPTANGQRSLTAPDVGAFQDSALPSIDDLARLEAAVRALAAMSPTPPPAGSSPLARELPSAPQTPPALPPASGVRPTPATVPPPAAAGAQAPAAPPSAQNSATEDPAPGPRHTLPEGTIIEAVLLNRLDGTFSGPVACLVTSPVYSHDRQHLLIPAGARLLGRAAPVQAWGDSRLAISFHRLVMPDGHTYSLDLFPGLNQTGETGLRDRVDRHYWLVFGASLAIGALSGLSQIGTRGGFDASFVDAYRQSAGASLANSAGRVLDRYLNVLPTVTVREGHRIKVYLTSDLGLPASARASRRQ